MGCQKAPWRDTVIFNTKSWSKCQIKSLKEKSKEYFILWQRFPENRIRQRKQGQSEQCFCTILFTLIILFFQVLTQRTNLSSTIIYIVLIMDVILLFLIWNTRVKKKSSSLTASLPVKLISSFQSTIYSLHMHSNSKGLQYNCLSYQ